MQFKTTACLAALLTSAAALALPQSEDVTVGSVDGKHDQVADLVEAYESVADAIPEAVAAPEGVTGTQTIPEDLTEVQEAAAADATSGSLSKRGTCQSTPSKYTSGPDVSTLTADQWKAITLWKQTALAASTPNGFVQVPNWRAIDHVAQTQPSRGYTSDLTSYDTAECARRCKQISGCSSFNIFFERAPTKDLDRTNCPSSPAQTVIKCGFWGIPLDTSAASNPGQIRGQNFFTSKAGSNAYNLIPATPEGFEPPVSFGVGSILAPQNLKSTYMGIQTFPGVSYNPQACADSCNEKSAYNIRHAKPGVAPRTCKFFNAYVAYKNDADPLFTCTYYTQSFGPEYATNVEQWDSAKNHFTKGSSYGFTLAQQREIRVEAQ